MLDKLLINLIKAELEERHVYGTEVEINLITENGMYPYLVITLKNRGIIKTWEYNAERVLCDRDSVYIGEMCINFADAVKEEALRLFFGKEVKEEP